MEKFIEKIKFEILYCLIYGIILYIIFIPLVCFCYEPVQTVIITKEDIMNAKPTPAPVKFNKKQLEDIEALERRHFPRTYPEFSDFQRLRNLEFELLGRVWEFSNQSDRIRTLKLASTNVLLSGVSLPASISSKQNAKRMHNDSIQVRKKNDVGLIDGFLRLLNPDLFEQVRKTEDKMFGYEY